MYFYREEKREAFKQEALQAWATYQETGRHLTAKQANDWLATWGTDDEGPTPECHE